MSAAFPPGRVMVFRAGGSESSCTGVAQMIAGNASDASKSLSFFMSVFVFRVLYYLLVFPSMAVLYGSNEYGHCAYIVGFGCKYNTICPKLWR